ncbi:MAG: WecB/TagA/CpsF family glycosyltransferase [Thermoflexales bacterium]|nr:WecB/TagA/CpsF family glycosyltransferase [Thermoflexales bacterium]
MAVESVRYLDILGVRVHDVTLAEALELAARFVAEGRPHQVATVNPEFVMAAQENAGFRAALNGADLCVPDGVGLVWASRWLACRPEDVRFRQRVAGVELAERLAARAAQEGWRVFLLGAAPGVAEKTAEVLQARYPGLVVAGTYAGSPAAEDEPAIIERIRQARPDVLFVAYGAPAQDVWIARNRGRLGVPLALGVGGSFDFISGLAKRAPAWVQRLGLEWLHRLVRQPWRWRRQLALPRFVWQVVRSTHDVLRFTFYVLRFLPLLLFLSVFALYLSTLAPGPVPGDPSEYTFVPHVLGISHPPGYAFYTLLAWLWQNAVRVGTLAYRTNMLAAAAGAAVAVLVFLIVNCQLLIVNGQLPEPDLAHGFQSLAPKRPQSIVPSLFGALSAAVAVDIWQHSLHANAHIVSALLSALSLFLLTRWAATEDDRWLYAFALVGGLGVTQHPLLVFGLPACALFILLHRPRLLLQPRQLAALAACFALGLGAWLYIPLRGPSAPFNRLDRSLEAFLYHVTAEGLRVNLFAFGLRDQAVRLSVFWQLLRLQYPPLTLALAGLGTAALAARRPRLLALFGLYFATYVLFVINTIQDVMAYLMLPFVVVAVLAGAGLETVGYGLTRMKANGGRWAGLSAYLRPAALLLLAVPLYTAWRAAPRVSLRDYRAGQAWVETAFARFAGRGEGAVLLTPWELMTPLWVAEAEGRPLDEADVKLVYVAATSANPYLDNVFAHWEEGPVYLADFRREVWEGGLFRLRPETCNLQPETFNLQSATHLWRVVAPGDRSVPAGLSPLCVRAENGLELVGYSLDTRRLVPGQTAHLDLALRSPTTPTHYLMPFARLGERAYRWTTDSRTLSPTWQPGEVIVERYDLTIPFGTPPGAYPLRLGVADLTDGRDLELDGGQTTIELGELLVEQAGGVVPPAVVLERAVANFDSRVALMGARACAGGRCVVIDPLGFRNPKGLSVLSVAPGQAIEVWLDWRALQQTEESYKAFVHLLKGEQVAAPPGDYYTPLGGAFPSALWIPRWIEGQAVSDPYRLLVPEGLAPGEYAIQAGLYGLTSLRRAPIFDRAGSLAGDRVILATVRVE